MPKMAQQPSHTLQSPEIAPALALVGYFCTLAVLVPQPRGTFVALLILTLFAIWGNIARRDCFSCWIEPDLPNLAFLGFCSWATIACAWSPLPHESLAKVALLTAVVISANVALRSGARTSVAVRQAAISGLCAVFILGAAYMTFEIATKQLLLRTYYEHFPQARLADAKHVRISKTNTITSVTDIFINRGILVWTLLAPAAWIGASRLPSRTLAAGMRIAVAVFFFVVLFASNHETSKLAIVVGISAALLDQIVGRRATLVAAAGWFVACAFIVPLAWAAASAQLENAAWLHVAARQRIPIWKYTSNRISDHPVIGHGTYATPTLHAEEKKSQLAAAKEGDPATRAARERAVQKRFASGARLAPHAHNVYLQVWLELGAIGAVLLLALGLVILRHISQLATLSRGPFLQLFAMVAAVLATSYGLWQLWFQSAIAVAAIMLALAL